ncbi:11047_t:CDS:2 [Racocetra persica]|uniref:11047_t:CDS:1 n=1 Tax=Racocetra persica TaxID=160502 RepID=A0ACA9RJT8_9GLOM|nr:11047_t:CDS:2 [Racocetra persica]
MSLSAVSNEQQYEENDNEFAAHCLKKQFVVDNYVKIEAEQLNYLHFNQDKIRRDLYSGLEDALNEGNTDASNTRRRIILPSSFIREPRDIH